VLCPTLVITSSEEAIDNRPLPQIARRHQSIGIHNSVKASNSLTWCSLRNPWCLISVILIRLRVRWVMKGVTHLLAAYRACTTLQTIYEYQSPHGSNKMYFECATMTVLCAILSGWRLAVLRRDRDIRNREWIEQTSTHTLHLFP
jgi:hypothetical protein